MSENKGAYITTVDNPYDPAEEFDKWFSYDEANGYHTCQLLDRVSNTSFLAFNDEDNEKEIERAIDEIIKIEGNDFYKKIVKE